MKFLKLGRKSYFKSMGPTSASTPEKTRLGFLKKSLAWVFFWRRFKNGTSSKTKTTVSPERTALMSFDDLSLFNESSHCFNSSQSSDSHSTPSPPLMPHETLEPWQKTKAVGSLNSNELNSQSIENAKSLKQSASIRRSLLYAFHKARLKSLMNLERDDQNSADDDESEHFSISTDLRYHQPFFQQLKINIISGNEAPSNNPPLPPPSDSSSVQTSRSAHSAPSSVSARESKSRISLDQFLEEQTQTSSLMTGPVYLNTIRADDAASVGSASLEVMFKGEYPQLVLTPSKDGTASKMTASSYGSNMGAAVKFTGRRSVASADVVPSKRLGFGTSSRSVSSFDSTKRTVSCTPQWLNDNIDRVWRQLDQCKSDPDGHYAPDDDPYDDPVSDVPDVVVNVYRYQFKNGTMTEVGVDDGDDKSNNSEIEEAETNTDDDLDAILNGRDLETYENLSDTEKINREEKLEVLSFRSFSPFDDMGWSLAESGTKSISQMIETEVIYPILKPICELVEATEIPEPEFDERRRSWKAPTSHRNPPSYRMSPRRPKSRMITKP
jgi:hypothetical protein